MQSLLRFLLPLLILSSAISVRGQTTQKGEATRPGQGAAATRPAALGTASDLPPE